MNAILTINGGSSSIKFALFTPPDTKAPSLRGQIERIGQNNTRLVARADKDSDDDIRPIDTGDYRQAAENLAGYLHEKLGRSTIAAIGHRIVHGGIHVKDHQLATPKVLAELKAAEPLDLAHLPREIALIETLGKSFESIPQIACFDTVFFRDLPPTSAILPIPRRFYNAGIRRLGFHGLSYTYLMQELNQIAGKTTASGKIILAHLGSGASLAALNQGKPIDTTMSFTPLAGLVMATRPGDIDPGLLLYLMRSEKLTVDQLDEFLSKNCGLWGISETSSDMRDLLSRRASDLRAADAVNIFCSQAKKYIAGLAAAMGGLDTLVFSGGIGENSAETRAGICDGLQFIGIRLDPGRNARGEDILSTDNSPVTVRRIATNEEAIIAQITIGLIQK